MKQIQANLGQHPYLDGQNQKDFTRIRENIPSKMENGREVAPISIKFDKNSLQKFKNTMLNYKSAINNFVNQHSTLDNWIYITRVYNAITAIFWAYGYIIEPKANPREYFGNTVTHLTTAALLLSKRQNKVVLAILATINTSHLARLPYVELNPTTPIARALNVMDGAGHGFNMAVLGAALAYKNSPSTSSIKIGKNEKNEKNKI